MTTQLVYLDPHRPLHVLVLDVIPSFLRVFLHTLTVRVGGTVVASGWRRPAGRGQTRRHRRFGEAPGHRGSKAHSNVVKNMLGLEHYELGSQVLQRSALGGSGCGVRLRVLC